MQYEAADDPSLFNIGSMPDVENGELMKDGDAVDELSPLHSILEDLLINKISTNVVASEIVQNVAQTVCTRMDELCKWSTARIWIQYLDMFDILHLFIKAEQTGS